MVAPQPPHHLGKNRPAHALAVCVHAPRVIHVVAFFGKRFHEPDVLKEPVAALVVAAAASRAAVVVAPILQKDPYRLLLALANDVGIRVAASITEVHEAADDAQ